MNATASRLLGYGIAATVLFTYPAVVHADEGIRQPDAEVRAQPPQNYCLGGIEDRKIIVDESRLQNPFKQTTLLGCEIDGGDPRTMPDLPAPSPVHTVLA